MEVPSVHSACSCRSNICDGLYHAGFSGCSRRHEISRLLLPVIDQVFWQGTLPPLQAHHRQFPSEDGAFVRLKEPITVSGTICRADWVDGASTRCRDTLDGGEPRQEDWKASGCSICAVFEVSPCSAIFTNKYVDHELLHGMRWSSARPNQDLNRLGQLARGGFRPVVVAINRSR